jgi:hypothetical protein
LSHPSLVMFGPKRTSKVNFGPLKPTVSVIVATKKRTI